MVKLLNLLQILGKMMNTEAVNGMMNDCITITLQYGMIVFL